MKIAIDTSAILGILLDEDSNKSIVKMTIGFDIVSAATLPYEVGNALVSNLRKKRITEPQALLASKNFEKMNIRLIGIDMQDSILMASKLGIYAYDSYMLSVALKLKIPLITLDKLMIESARVSGIKVVEVI